MKQRISALLLAGVLVLGLAACGGSAEPPEDAGETAAAEKTAVPGITPFDLKIGLILAGETFDAYNKNHIEGMQAACESLGIDYDAQVTVLSDVSESAACADAIADLAEAGCQAVFAVSFGQEQYVEDAAPDYPDVQFFQAAGYQCASDNLDNTHNYFARIDQARYLTGIAAGLKTRTGKLGYVASKPYAEVISGYTAFYLGAKSVNPDVTMLVNYTNQWSDAEGEAANAQALIDLGCDVISQHSDTSAPAVTAEINGVFAVGYNEDMVPMAPHAALVSAQVNWGVYYEYALGCLLSGENVAQDWCGDYAEGACGLTPLNEEILAEGTREAVDDAAAGFYDGTLQVFAGPLHGVDADGRELNLAKGEAYAESETSSAPSFAFIVDGVMVLS